MYILINIYTSRVIISELILIRTGLRTLIEFSRVYTSLYRLIIKSNFVFTNSLFNNRVELSQADLE
jgi:hypothetical protein